MERYIDQSKLLSLHHLASGTARQRKAYAELIHSKIFELLAKFSPVLAGTIPLDIDIPGSDLDIICEANDLLAFQDLVQTLFSKLPFFKISAYKIRGVDSIVSSFQLSEFEVELFCQSVPVTKQFAVVHLFIEHRLLELGGEKLKHEMRALKNQGMKTEPAFALYLELAGDPYDALAALTSHSDDELATMIALKQNSSPQWRA